jgi:hypothetical protein
MVSDSRRRQVGPAPSDESQNRDGFCDFFEIFWYFGGILRLCSVRWILGVPFPPILRSSVRNRKAIGGAGSLCLGVLILGVAGSQGKLVPATMSRSMETNPTKRGICEEEKWVSE